MHSKAAILRIHSSMETLSEDGIDTSPIQSKYMYYDRAQVLHEQYYTYCNNSILKQTEKVK